MAMSGQPNVSLLTDDDVYLFNEGSHFCLYEKLGAHVIVESAGTYFCRLGAQRGASLRHRQLQ